MKLWASSIVPLISWIWLLMIWILYLEFVTPPVQYQIFSWKYPSARRKLVPNIPLLYETRWSKKYKSIRLFYGNFMAIKTVFDQLAVRNDVNSSTRSRAFQLSCATPKDIFVVCLIIILTYSSVLEPVVNKLQSVKTNLYTVHQCYKFRLSTLIIFFNIRYYLKLTIVY